MRSSVYSAEFFRKYGREQQVSGWYLAAELLTGYCDQALSPLRLRYEVFFDTGYGIWLFRKEKKMYFKK